MFLRVHRQGKPAVIVRSSQIGAPFHLGTVRGEPGDESVKLSSLKGRLISTGGRRKILGIGFSAQVYSIPVADGHTPGNLLSLAPAAEKRTPDDRRRDDQGLCAVVFLHSEGVSPLRQHPDGYPDLRPFHTPRLEGDRAGQDERRTLALGDQVSVLVRGEHRRSRFQHHPSGVRPGLHHHPALQAASSGKVLHVDVGPGVGIAKHPVGGKTGSPVIPRPHQEVHGGSRFLRQLRHRDLSAECSLAETGPHHHPAVQAVEGPRPPGTCGRFHRREAEEGSLVSEEYPSSGGLQEGRHRSFRDRPFPGQGVRGVGYEEQW